MWLHKPIFSGVYLSAGLCTDESGDSTEVVIVSADEHPEERGFSAAPVHILRRLWAQLQLHWSLTAGVRLCMNKMNELLLNGNKI